MIKTVISLVGIFLACGLCLAQSNQSRPLKATYKEKAAYTDEAIKRRIEGTVTLNVTFEMNGKIGEIEYLTESSKKKLLSKYGLAEAAIAAAKNMKFEPALEKGIPNTVKKKVEFLFLLPPRL